jgi:hypothetical protein
MRTHQVEPAGAEGKYWFLPGETSLARGSEESAEAVVAMKAGESRSSEGPKEVDEAIWNTVPGENPS